MTMRDNRPGEPVWTEGKLQAPCMAAARHTCQQIVSRPPVPVTGFGVKHVGIVVAAAKAGLALIEKDRETIERIEATGSPWRLRIPLKSAAQCGLKDRVREYEAIVAELVAAGWLVVAGGGSPKRAAVYELRDPR